MDQKSVLVDIGAAAGLKKDNVLTVSRAGRILGKIKICVVIDDSLSNADIVESADDFLPGDDVVLESVAPGQVAQPPKEVTAPEKPPSPELTGLSERLSLIEDKLALISEKLQNLESVVKDHSEKIAALASVPPQKIETPASAVFSGEQPKPQPPPASTQAKVAYVEGAAIYIWAGTSQGVKEGDVFAIKRDGKVIARVRIDQVESETGDMCRGQIISKTANIDRATDIAEKE